MYNQNALLKHAIETFEKKKPSPLYSFHGKARLPPLPQPGEVDMIVGGPPCQPFSGMNRNKVSMFAVLCSLSLLTGDS